LIYFILNPTAGSGKAKAAVPVIERIMCEHGVEYSFVYTSRPDDLTRVSGLIDLDAAKTIVSVGGDGTIQEYISLVIDREINFGVIPAGSGNDFMYSAPGNKRKFSSFEEKITYYTEKIIKGEIMYIDAIKVNDDKYCLNIGGTGIDIQVLKDALPLKKFFDRAAYFISLIKNAVTYRAVEMKLTVDDQSRTERFLLLAFCNGSYYGGNMHIAPSAVINDGFITLCEVKKMPRLKLITMFPLVKSGRHTKLKDVSFINCSYIKLEFSGKKTINLDGNLFEFESPLTFKIMKDAVRFIA